jgi:hypothetical protein
MSLRPYKFLVYVVAQETDEHGNVIGEATIARDNGEPFTVYGIDGLTKFADEAPELLATVQKAKEQ